MLRRLPAVTGGATSLTPLAAPAGTRPHTETLVAQMDLTDVMIQPQKTTPPLDASKWPLLLKNYDKLNVRAAPGSACLKFQHRQGVSVMHGQLLREALSLAGE